MIVSYRSRVRNLKKKKLMGNFKERIAAKIKKREKKKKKKKKTKIKKTKKKKKKKTQRIPKSLA